MMKDAFPNHASVGSAHLLQRGLTRRTFRVVAGGWSDGTFWDLASLGRHGWVYVEPVDDEVQFHANENSSDATSRSASGGGNVTWALSCLGQLGTYVKRGTGGRSWW